MEEVGKNVKHFKAGDRIIGIAGLEYGAYAEYKCLPEDGVMIAKPSPVEFYRRRAFVRRRINGSELSQGCGPTSKRAREC